MQKRTLKAKPIQRADPQREVWRPASRSFAAVLDILGFIGMTGTVLYMLYESAHPLVLTMRSTNWFSAWAPMLIALATMLLAGINSERLAKVIRLYLDVRRRVFVSYDAADRDVARRLGSNLNKKGFRVFLAHDNVRPGEAWRPQLEGAMKDSDLLVFFVPERLSDEARQELNLARQQHLKIVPVITRHNAALPAQIQEITPIDWTALPKDAPDNLAKLMESIPAFS